MARGNQRDLAREKAAKKDKGKAKSANEQDANKGLTKEQRMARDAEIMRLKQQKKAAKKNAGKAKSANEQDANKGLTKEQRMARDAEIMRLKQQKKAEAAAAGGSGGK